MAATMTIKSNLSFDLFVANQYHACCQTRKKNTFKLKRSLCHVNRPFRSEFVYRLTFISFVVCFLSYRLLFRPIRRSVSKWLLLCVKSTPPKIFYRKHYFLFISSKRKSHLKMGDSKIGEKN